MRDEVVCVSVPFINSVYRLLRTYERQNWEVRFPRSLCSVPVTKGRPTIHPKLVFFFKNTVLKYYSVAYLVD